MSKILTPAILDGYTRKKDKSVSIRFITQEKTPHEVMEIDSMLDQFGILYFRGEERMNKDEIKELDEIELDLYDTPKTQSQRLRNTMFLIWKQEGEKGEFKDYYKAETEKIITHYKNKIHDE